MKPVKLTLYSTAICHLCDEALAVLEPLKAQGQIQLKVIDIVDDDALYPQYKTRIPVLSTDTGQELNWPFDFSQVCALIISA
jgi:hypothetical protein